MTRRGIGWKIPATLLSAELVALLGDELDDVLVAEFRATLLDELPGHSRHGDGIALAGSLRSPHQLVFYAVDVHTFLSHCSQEVLVRALRGRGRWDFGDLARTTVFRLLAWRSLGRGGA